MFVSVCFVLLRMLSPALHVFLVAPCVVFFVFCSFVCAHVVVTAVLLLCQFCAVMFIVLCVLLSMPLLSLLYHGADFHFVVLLRFASSLRFVVLRR